MSNGNVITYRQTITGRGELAGRKILVESRVKRLGKRRALSVHNRSGIGWVIDFVRPVRKDDFRNGELQPAAEAALDQNQFHTMILLSEEVLKELKSLLNRCEEL